MVEQYVAHCLDLTDSVIVLQQGRACLRADADEVRGRPEILAQAHLGRSEEKPAARERG